MHNCKHCGVLFEKKHWLQTHCTKTCAYAAVLARANARYVPRTGEPWGAIPKDCVICGSPFKAKTPKALVCGPECKRARKKAVGKAASTKAKARERNARADIKASTRVRSLMRKALVRGKNGRAWSSIVGYSLDDLMARLEAQFVEGMGWHNMAEWHIDHIRPLASFSFETVDCPEFKQAWSLENLRPLWGKENISKGSRWLGVHWRKGGISEVNTTPPRHECAKSFQLTRDEFSLQE